MNRTILMLAAALAVAGCTPRPPAPEFVSVEVDYGTPTTVAINESGLKRPKGDLWVSDPMMPAVSARKDIAVVPARGINSGYLLTHRVRYASATELLALIRANPTLTAKKLRVCAFASSATVRDGNSVAEGYFALSENSRIGVLSRSCQWQALVMQPS